MGFLTKTTEALEPVNHCRNCKKELGAEQLFCDRCGAKRIENRLTARNLLEDFNERYLNIENALLKTFLALFVKPEEVIDGYIHGVRKKYLSAFGYFGIAVTLAGLYVYVFNTFFAEEYFEFYDTAEDTPQAEQIMNMTKRFVETLNDYQAITSFLTIPFLAAISRLLFIDFRKYNYIEHLVIFLYAFSQYSIVNSIFMVFLVPFPTMSVLLSILLQVLAVTYVAYVFHKLYSLSAGQTLLKTFLFVVISPVLFIIAILIIGLMGYWLGWFDAFIEMVKA